MEAVALRRLTHGEFRKMEFDDNHPFQYEEIKMYTLTETGRYEPFCVATVEDELDQKDSFLLTSKLLPELQIDIRQLF